MDTEHFNPLYVLGKRVSEAKLYFEKFNISYTFDNCLIKFATLAIHKSYKEGTHIYKIYNYNIPNEDDAIITHFQGVTDAPLIQSFENNSGNISGSLGNILTNLPSISFGSF